MNHPSNTIHQQPALSKARVLTRQAERWANHVLDVTDLRPAYVWRKALGAARFSSEVGASSLAIPSKLYGARERQAKLRQLHDLNLVRGHRLTVEDDGDRIEVRFTDTTLGFVQSKHVPWLRPLLDTGVSAHLLQVTGTESTRKFYGVNIAIVHACEALSRLQQDIQGDGLPTAAQAPDVEPVRLWREQGEARMSIRGVVRHSPTGIEWGYVGSGPSDLAYSIVTHVADEETADRYAHFFMHTVIARVPKEGVTLRPEAVREWVGRQE